MFFICVSSDSLIWWDGTTGCYHFHYMRCCNFTFATDLGFSRKDATVYIYSETQLQRRGEYSLPRGRDRGMNTLRRLPPCDIRLQTMAAATAAA